MLFCGCVEAGEGFVKIAVVSPHRDDAAFALSLTIGTWLERGHAVDVVNCFTRSERAPFSDADSVHANDRMTYVTGLRRKEDESWRKQFGAKLRCLDLNLKDAPLRLRCGVDEVSSVAIKVGDKALGRIAKALEESKPGAVVLPLALGRDVDHRTAREAGFDFLRTRTGVACGFYEELPEACAEAGVDDAAGAAGELLGAELSPGFAGAAVEVEAATRNKLRLVLRYDSQVDDATAAAIAGACGRYGGRERVWGSPAWRKLGL
jgi:LmbE family N-acetylglucosaminyl deacetylase